MLKISFLLLVFTASCVLAVPTRQDNSELDDSWMHPKMAGGRRTERALRKDVEEESAEFWVKAAQNDLKERLSRPLNIGVARNVIMFLGDGMSIPTLAAARIYKGQLNGETGEENMLSFEKFPFSGLSRTYCVDSQVADSSCSATAYLCGVKANLGTMGVSATVKRGDCEGMRNTSNQVQSILRWSKDAKKATGIVTTTRVTHASPGGNYAHIADRNWECDADVAKDGQNPLECDDIAEQLIRGNPGRDIKVVLGGGRREFLPKEFTDEEGKNGMRTDGVNLIKEWQQDKLQRGATHRYVWNREGLLQTDTQKTEYLLGLFKSDHTPYHLEADPKTDPTLAEMTATAIRVLRKEPKGFFLFVEGGRIDHGHHETKVKKALDETLEMALAVQMAVKLTSERDTLIVITSDHAHTMSISGYPKRGNNVLGLAGKSNVDNLPYATLSYANGQGFTWPDAEGNRHNLSNDNMEDPNYQFPATTPLIIETHGGDDVAIFARGPWSHLFSGSLQQNAIPHAMAFASCVGKGLTVCTQAHRLRN